MFGRLVLVSTRGFSSRTEDNVFIMQERRACRDNIKYGWLTFQLADGVHNIDATGLRLSTVST